MVSKTAIDGFLAQKSLALAGMSRGGRKFGNKVFEDLTRKGSAIHVVHPEATEIGGVRCDPLLTDAPFELGGLVLVVPPRQTERLVREARTGDINRVRMQPGAESDDAIRFCTEEDIVVIHGECIMIHADPRGIHNAHRWIRGALGRMQTDDV